MFFQRAPIEEIETMIKAVKSTSVGLEPVRAALFSKVHDVIKLVQTYSNFNEPRQGLYLVYLTFSYIMIIDLW